MLQSLVGLIVMAMRFFAVKAALDIAIAVPAICIAIDPVV